VRPAARDEGEWCSLPWFHFFFRFTAREKQ